MLEVDPAGLGGLLGAFTLGAAVGVASRRRPDSIRALSDIWVRPGASKFGVGLISIRPVPEGTCICYCNPRYSRTVSNRELDSFLPEVRRTIHELFDGYDEPPGTCVLPTDYDQAIPLISFINHSLRPNCEYDPRANAIVTSRPLKAGEEATINYFEYQDDVSYTSRAARAGFSPTFVYSLYPKSDTR